MLSYTVIFFNVLSLISLSAVCLAWNHFSRKMSKSPCISSCSDDDTNKRIRGSSRLSLWLAIVFILLTLGGGVYMFHKARGGAIDSQEIN